MPRASRQPAHSSKASNTSRQLKRSFSDISPFFAPSVAPSTPNEPSIGRTQISNNFVGGRLLAYEELGTRSSNDKNVRFSELHDTTSSCQEVSVPLPLVVGAVPASSSRRKPMNDPTPDPASDTSDTSSNRGNNALDHGPNIVPQASLPSLASGTGDIPAAPIPQLTPQQLAALQQLSQQMFGSTSTAAHQSSEASTPAFTNTRSNTRSVSAAPIPQLTPQQLTALQQLYQQMFGNTNSAAHESSEAPAPVSTNTRSRSLQPSTSARSRSRSLQPSTSAHVSDDVATFSDSAEDSDDEPLGDKIPRPKGEVTRISRHGFNISKQLIENGWSNTDVDKLSKHIRAWVYRYLEPEKSYTLQNRANIRHIKQIAKDKYPALEKFHNLWPVDAYIRSKLKYSNEAARSVERGQKAARNSARLSRSNRDFTPTTVLGLSEAAIMPASVLPPYHCKCKGCVALNGPAGRTIPGKDKISHLNRVQAELDQEARFLTKDPESDIFLSTLVDDIPVATTEKEQIDPRESRLWSSNDPLSMANLLASLPSYSASSTSVRSNSKPQSVTTTPDDTDDSEDYVSDSDDSITVRPTSRVLKTGIPKEERNILTSKAHQSLDVVEKRIQQCLDKIDIFEATTASPASSIYVLEAEISKIQQTFDKVTRTVASVVNRKKSIKNGLNRLHERFEHLRSQYDESHHLQGQPLAFDSSHHFSMPINDYNSIAQITMLITAIANVVMGVSRRFGDLLLGLHKVLVRQAFIEANQSPTITPAQDDILNQIPNTLKTAIQKFNLGCKTVTYAVCPECNCTYAPRFQPGAQGVPIYPDKCNNQPTPETTCNASLLDDSSSPPVPHKKFQYHSFHDYVASLLARKDLENLMDKACDDLVYDMEANTSKPRSSPVKDFFQGEYIRTFKGHDQKLFVKRPKDEGRLCFVFNVDYFNAEGQSIRGPSASVGLISGACLNLPLDIRYKPENMFLAGIIPGPSEPTLTEINHFTRYLVDDLLVSYTCGVHYSRTANHPDGRLVQCAASIFINDLPAARQVNGSASYNSHNYCHSCGCVHIMTLPRTDIDADVWRPRKASDLRKLAEAWKDAPTQARREELFTESGYRWTELWRLPYYDPARMLAVDSMHCLLEGLVQYHFRSVLSLTDISAQTAEQKPAAFDFDFRIPDENWYNTNYKPDADGRRHVKQIHKFLIAPIGREGMDDQAISQSFDKLSKRLESKTLASLRFVAENVDPAGTLSCKQKADYVKVLLQWRKTCPLRVSFDPTLHIKYGTTGTINRIREVILDMDSPSWLRSVPSNFGASAAGSLKADEWRTMATVYIPVALVSLWGEGTTHASAKVAAGLRRALNHTMNLVAAVTLACKGTMTEEVMDAYREELSEWRVNLTRIHPEASHTPNSHMAVHIYEYLHLFGPVRSWWCFPFERMIGQLQRLGSNHKYGDLEITLADSYRKAAKLRSWFQRPDCPDFLKDCQKIMY